MITYMKYRKKPVVITAAQYVQAGKLVRGMCNSMSCHREPHVHTIHNEQIVLIEVGDWILPESDGQHFYPCKPDIFVATYEPAVLEKYRHVPDPRNHDATPPPPPMSPPSAPPVDNAEILAELNIELLRELAVWRNMTDTLGYLTVLLFGGAEYDTLASCLADAKDNIHDIQEQIRVLSSAPSESTMTQPSGPVDNRQTMNMCRHCQQMFISHKQRGVRRGCCEWCAAQPAPAPRPPRKRIDE